MKKITFVVVWIELIIIGVLFFHLVPKLRMGMALKTISVSPIEKEALVYSPNSEFKYYYEEKPSQNITRKIPWENSYYTNSINKDGLNERFDYEIKKPDETFRIITLGDSFTYGLFVDIDKNWTEVLEDKLNKDIVCANYKKYGAKYNPDLIIWFESGTGFRRYMEKMWPIIDTCQKETDKKSDQPLKEYTKCWDNGYEQMISSLPLDSLRQELKNYMNYFLQLRNVTPVLFSTFENITQEDKNTLNSYTESQRNVFVMDKITDIYSKGGTLPDSHPNEKGHQIIAIDLFSYLIKNKETLMRCN